jgi:hypothetical protein
MILSTKEEIPYKQQGREEKEINYSAKSKGL